MTEAREEEPKLPRPLEPNEFYCWLCEQFVPIAESEAHAKDHRQKGRTV